MIAYFSGVEIEYLKNPRLEAEENELNVEHEQFAQLGLTPTTLSGGLLDEIRDIAFKYRARVDESKILATSQWKTDVKK